MSISEPWRTKGTEEQNAQVRGDGAVTRQGPAHSHVRWPAAPECAGPQAHVGKPGGQHGAAGPGQVSLPVSPPTNVPSHRTVP